MKFKKPTLKEFKEAPSETAKYRHITAPYCMPDGVPSCGVDLASQGDPVVRWAIQLDLPVEEFNRYCGGAAAKGPIQLRGHAHALPFDSESLDFVYSSHLLEDYADWVPVLTEWVRVLRPNGYLIILVPDKERWAQALKSGQSSNDAHRHESEQGELSTYAKRFGMEIVMDELANLHPGDYTIIGIFRKIKGGWEFK